MITSTEMVGLLANGVVSAAMFLGIAFVLRRYTRFILAGVLIIAALVYISFVFQAGEGLLWLLVELVGVGIYGAMGMRGVRGSPWWLVAGWAFHPVWDMALHFFGPGHSFAPISYTIPCLSFDLVVAGCIALAITRGWFVADKPVLQDSAI